MCVCQNACMCHGLISVIVCVCLCVCVIVRILAMRVGCVSRCGCVRTQVYLVCVSKRERDSESVQAFVCVHFFV